ncbi:MAG: hypothetical protein KGI93_13625, partial [Acidobacteriota bacterium]|nr:hypothetical protein [Acidobacteriota bacterium]
MKQGPQVPTGTIVAVTVGLVVALGLRPVSVREILAAYVLALAAIALVVLARLARTQEEWERATSELERALAPRRPVRARPNELVRVERDLVLSSSNGAEFHARLRPLLLEIAAARVGRLEDALDRESFELLRPDRPPPDDRGAPG